MTAVQQWMRRPGRRNARTVDLDAIVNCGLTSSVGITLSDLDPAATYTITLPPGRLYTAWSYNLNESGTWVHQFRVTTAAGTTIIGPSTPYATAEAARLAFVPADITGYASYTFWLADQPVVTDNLGGLSLLLTRTG